MKIETMIAKNNLGDKIAETLRAYAKTQLILVIITTAISWLVLKFLGVRFPLLLAMLTGSLSVVPTLGAITAAIVTAIVAVFDNARFLPNMPELVEGLMIFVIYGLLNVFVDYFLSPYFLNKHAKIHPVLVLLAVLIGSTFFGFFGAFLAVPVVLVVKTVIDHVQKNT